MAITERSRHHAEVMKFEDLPAEVRAIAYTMEDTAYHEAGHAVVAWHFQCPVRSVLIRQPVFGANGRPVTGGGYVDCDVEPRRQIPVLLAGAEAQRQFGNVRDEHHVSACAKSDHHEALECARRLHLGGWVYLGSQRGLVADLMRRYAVEVRCVFSALMVAPGNTLDASQFVQAVTARARASLKPT